MANACFVFDLTFSLDKNPDKSLISSFFKLYAKQWGYQLEQGTTTGYKHWQCRISLKEKIRSTGLYKLIIENNLAIATDAISVTSRS